MRGKRNWLTLQQRKLITDRPSEKGFAEGLQNNEQHLTVNRCINRGSIEVMNSIAFFTESAYLKVGRFNHLANARKSVLSHLVRIVHIQKTLNRNINNVH